MSAHVHTIPVPLGMTPDEAWAEITTLGKLVHPPADESECGWANIECDGEQCNGIAFAVPADIDHSPNDAELIAWWRDQLPTLTERSIAAGDLQHWLTHAYDRLERVNDALDDALMHVRLALTAGELIADGFSDDRDEPQRILSALCQRLVAAGAVDPMEADAASGEST